MNIPFTVVSDEMVAKAAVQQGYIRLRRMGVRVDGVDAKTALFYADDHAEIRAMLCAALDEEDEG